MRALYRFSLPLPLSLPPSLSETPGGLVPLLKKLGSVKLKLAKASVSRARAVDGVTPSASSSSFLSGSSISHSCVCSSINRTHRLSTQTRDTNGVCDRPTQTHRHTQTHTRHAPGPRATATHGTAHRRNAWHSTQTRHTHSTQTRHTRHRIVKKLKNQQDIQ